MKRILVIDDEPVIVQTISIILEDLGINVTGVLNPVVGIQKALDEDFNLILSDVRMPEMNGADVTKKILEKKPDARILIITAYPLDIYAKNAMDAGAIALIKKPFEVSKILDYLGD